MTYKFFLFDRYMKNKIKTYNTIVVRNQVAQPDIGQIYQQLNSGERGMSQHYQRSQSMYGKILPQCIPGGLSSRKRNCRSLMATARRLGAAQIFGTLTMNSKWNELLSRCTSSSWCNFVSLDARENAKTIGVNVTMMLRAIHGTHPARSLTDWRHSRNICLERKVSLAWLLIMRTTLNFRIVGTHTFIIWCGACHGQQHGSIFHEIYRGIICVLCTSGDSLNSQNSAWLTRFCCFC